MFAQLFSAEAALNSKRLANNAALRQVERFDWTTTPIGPLEQWPSALCCATRIALSAAAPIAVIAGSAGILIYNDSMARTLGPLLDGALGRPIASVLPHAKEFYRRVILQCEAGEAPRFQNQPLKVIRDNEIETAWFNLEFTPILNFDGSYIGAMLMATDVTARMRAERALQRSEERLSLALNAPAMVGLWDFDLKTGIGTADERLARIFGLDPAATRSGVEVDAFFAAIHPDDRLRVKGEINIAINEKEPYRTQYRVVDVAGKTRWILASAQAVRDRNGTAIRLPGIAIDISEQVEATAALRESEFRFQTLLETLPQIVWTATASGEHDYFSSRWYQFTGVVPGTITPDLWRDYVHPDDLQVVLARWSVALSTAEPYEIEYRFRHHSGEFRWLSVLALPLKDQYGRVTRWCGTSTDIHEAKRATAEREVIASELNHRIKNIFSLTSGLIALAAREQPQMKNFAHALIGRLAALAQAHDLILAKGGPTDVPPLLSIRELISRILRPYVDDSATRIRLRGDDTSIDERGAVSLALVLHELATNSTKYGALAEPNGSLRVELIRGADTLKIIWKESAHGIRRTSMAASSGFGTKLLSLSIEEQMKGSYTRHWDDDGLRIEIEIPNMVLANPSAPHR
jgi:PAS domain S-box-containing protein